MSAGVRRLAGTVFDVVLGLVLIAYASAGWGRGLFATAFAAAGFVAGGLLGLWLWPGVLTEYLPMFLPADAALWRPLVLVVLVLFTAALGQSLLSRLALPATRSIRASGLRVIDSALGSLLTLVVAAVAAWVAAGVLALAPMPALREAVSSSKVLALIDDAVPVRRGEVLDRVLVAMDTYRFPRVFTDGTRPDLGAVDAPADAATEAPGVQQAAASVYRIDAIAPRCGRTQEGSGWALDHDLVVTNAHVVAGADDISIRAGEARRSAEVVAFDPRRDLALLSVDGLGAAPLPLGTDASRGDEVVMAGYPLGGAFTTESGRVGLRMAARGADIYGQGNVVRDIYAVRGVVQPGNSGGPALASDGSVVGVVFARAIDDSDIAYVLTLDELNGMLMERPAPGPDGTTACAA